MRREKVHKCLSCPKSYADLKGLSKHIQEAHNGPVMVQPTFAPSPVPCPYCTNTYSRRDKMLKHVRTIHPDREVPKMTNGGGSPAKPVTITPMTMDDDIICLEEGTCSILYYRRLLLYYIFLFSRQQQLVVCCQ